MIARRAPSRGVNWRRGKSTSSGSTSSRTNASIQSSFSWNSGSVSKSQDMAIPLDRSVAAALGPACRSGAEAVQDEEPELLVGIAVGAHRGAADGGGEDVEHDRLQD